MPRAWRYVPPLVRAHRLSQPRSSQILTTVRYVLPLVKAHRIFDLKWWLTHRFPSPATVSQNWEWRWGDRYLFLPTALTSVSVFADFEPVLLTPLNRRLSRVVSTLRSKEEKRILSAVNIRNCSL